MPTEDHGFVDGLGENANLFIKAFREATSHLNTDDLKEKCSGTFLNGHEWNWLPELGAISVSPLDSHPEDSNIDSNNGIYSQMANFLVHTVAHFVSRNTEVLITDIVDKSIDFEFNIDGFESIGLRLNKEQCMDMMKNPTSDTTINLLETVTKTIGISPEHIAAVEVLETINGQITDS